MANFEEAIEVVLKHEGGLVNDRVDPGGITNFGVSLRFLKTTGELDYDFDGDGDIDCDDIKCMTRDQACEVYKNCWWDKFGYDRINSDDVATKLLDTAVNMGQKQAVKLLQRALKRLSQTNYIAADGVMGPMTVNEINKSDSQKLLSAMRSECANFYLELIAAKPVFEKYRNGWLRRAYA